MRDFIAVDAAFVTAQIERLKVLFPDLTRDAELLATAVEGETNFDRVMAQVIERFLDAVEIKDAIAKRQANLKERGDRYGRKAEAMRELAFGLMRAAEQQTIRLPEATISVAAGRRRLVIDDLAALPQGFTRTEVTPLRAEIAAELTIGDVPGAHLEAAEPHLSIRTK